LLQRLAGEGTTVFISSHLLAEVEAMCDRVGVLAQGRLVADGPPGELRKGADVVRLEVDDSVRARAILGTLAVVEIEPGEVLRVRLSPPATSAAVNAALVAGGGGARARAPPPARAAAAALTR